MATLVQSTLSIIDELKNVDGKGRFIDVIEAMNSTSQYCMDDWVWMPANSGTKHVRSIRTGLPSVAWTALYEGIPQSKSQKQNIEDVMGMVEGLAPVDMRQLKLYAGNEAAIRAAEGRAYIESMAQELLTAMFYHNPATNPRLPKGLGARFGTLATSGAGAQIIDAGGTGSDNTSIWMVEWGYDGLSVIHPEGTVAGIQRENKGQQRKEDSAGNAYYIEEEYFSATLGFSLGDWQRIARVANIDVSNMQAGSVALYDFLRRAYYKMKTRRTSKVMDQTAPGRVAIYCNRDVLESLDRLATNNGSTDNFTRLRWGEIEGKEVLTYRGIPIRETDALLNTEARVV